MKLTDVLAGEVFEWKGDRYRLQFHNRNCVQANKAVMHGYSKTYTVIGNDTDVELQRSALGREHLVTK